MEWFAFAMEIVPKLVMEIVKLCQDTGKDVKEMRRLPMTVSISFGGGEGDAVVVAALKAGAKGLTDDPTYKIVVGLVRGFTCPKGG